MGETRKAGGATCVRQRLTYVSTHLDPLKLGRRRTAAICSFYSIISSARADKRGPDYHPQ